MNERASVHVNDNDASKPRVLLAEDHPLNQRVATVMLEQLGFRVHVVADGAEAVKASKLTRYHAIFMDCQIPVLDGYQATAAIRLHPGASCHTPIVAVTASGVGSDRQRCLDAGMDDYLTKPLSLKKLAAVLARVAPGRSVDARAAGGGTDFLTAPRADASGGSVLDPQVVARLERLGRAAGQDLFAQVTVLFLADAGSLLAALRDAFARHDAPAIVSAAHTLGGASANLGATQLARLCARLSATGTTGTLVGTAALLDAVEAELTQVRAVLDASVLTP